MSRERPIEGQLTRCHRTANDILHRQMTQHWNSFTLLNINVFVLYEVVILLLRIWSVLANQRWKCRHEVCVVYNPLKLLNWLQNDVDEVTVKRRECKALTMGRWFLCFVCTSFLVNKDEYVKQAHHVHHPHHSPNPAVPSWCGRYMIYTVRPLRPVRRLYWPLTRLAVARQGTRKDLVSVCVCVRVCVCVCVLQTNLRACFCSQFVQSTAPITSTPASSTSVLLHRNIYI